MAKGTMVSSGQEVTNQQDWRLQTRQLTPELITYIVEQITRLVSPERIILFGSYARGEATASSDLDLFIIQDGRASNREVRRQIESLLWGRRFGMDLIVRKSEEVARNVADGNPFYTRHLFGEGKVLYERAR
jgi:predicted nucleotidyltransferase